MSSFACLLLPFVSTVSLPYLPIHLHFAITFFNQDHCPKSECDYLYSGETVTVTKISQIGWPPELKPELNEEEEEEREKEEEEEGEEEKEEEKDEREEKEEEEE